VAVRADQDPTADDASAFDAIPLRELRKMIAEAVNALGEADTRALRKHFAATLETPVPRTRVRLFEKFIWSAKGRGYIRLSDDDLGDWVRTDVPAEADDAFGAETFASICDLIEALDPDRSASFDELIDLTVHFMEDRDCSGTRLVRRTVASAIWASGRRSE
jgi:hypothetical protein